jgi:FMN phosphatase YigB (HAD superfamily)
MSFTLLQYADHLDTRDLGWPVPPEVEVPRATPHLERLPEVRAITWSVYGTLLAIGGGALYFEHPNRFIMEVALDKTIQEFKMWSSMARKPGQPSEYLRKIYLELLGDQRIAPSIREKYPEVQSDRLWEAFIRKLQQKEYVINRNLYGDMKEFCQKVAYFFHASLQGTACYPKTAQGLRTVKAAGLAQGLLTDGQCFTAVQLERALHRQDSAAKLDELVDRDLHVCSYELKARKPSDRLYKHMLGLLGQRGITPEKVLHIGSRISLDVLPAKHLGMKTGLFAGDLASLEANTSELLRDPENRPDILLTNLSQIADVIG